MKYSAIALAAFAALTAAQADISIIPECAIGCIDDARVSDSDCADGDYECLCDNITTLRGVATTCVIAECGATAAIDEVLPAVEEFCEAVAANPAPAPAPSSSAAPAPSSSAAPAPASSSAAAPASSSSAAAPASSSAPAASSGYPVASSSAAPVASSSAAPAPSGEPVEAGAGAVVGSFGLAALAAVLAL